MATIPVPVLYDGSTFPQGSRADTERKTMSADVDLARIELVAERNMDNWFDLKEALANERERQGLSTAELAHRMAVTEAYVLELERDEANPTVSTLRRWLGALGTSMTCTLDFPT